MSVVLTTIIKQVFNICTVFICSKLSLRTFSAKTWELRQLCADPRAGVAVLADMDPAWSTTSQLQRPNVHRLLRSIRKKRGCFSPCIILAFLPFPLRCVLSLQARGQTRVWIWLAGLHRWRSPTPAYLARCAWRRCALSSPPSPRCEDLGHPPLGGRLLLRFLLWPPCPRVGSYLSLVFITCADHV
jgi:hypothetical protein